MLKITIAFLLLLALIAGGFWYALRPAPVAEIGEALEAPGLDRLGDSRTRSAEDLPPAPGLKSQTAGTGAVDRVPFEPSRTDTELAQAPGLFGQGPARPSRGDYEKPIIQESFDDGRPYFEAQQILGEDGIWGLHGRWTAWYENGQKQEQGWYERQRETGEWFWWDENGQLVCQGSFIEGKREGMWTFWYENGVKMADANYAGGVGTGLWRMFYEDGGRWSEGRYIDGEIAGPWTVWNESGEVNAERTGIYSGGKLISH